MNYISYPLTCQFSITYPTLHHPVCLQGQRKSNRKTADLKSAVLITEKLKQFDKNDPIKYDFAIYRLGQEKLF